MKKFSKILTLLLAIVAIVSVFTVVALAEDEAALSPVTTGGYNFEDKAQGASFNNSDAKLGKWTVGSADNGNKYVIAENATATGTNGDNWDPTVTNWYSYPVDEYPTFAFDFDIMSNTGAFYASATIRTDLYGGAYSARITQMKSVKLNSDGIKLKNLANVWQHVTYIVRYEGNGVFGLYFYVDGVLTATSSLDYNVTAFSAKDKRYTFTNWNDVYDEEGNLTVEGLADENDNLKFDRLSVGTVSLYPPYSTSTSVAEQISYDNLKFTFYPENYTNDEVASYIYNEDYEMPYGQTEATLTDKETGTVTWYDDFDKAFAAADETNILTIMKDTAGSYEINKVMNVNMNGFAFDYFSNTGYVPTVNGDVYEFALASQTVTVVWDPVCADGECSCYELGIGHELTATSIVALGYAPEYNASTFVNKHGVYAEFLGWSYTKGGEAEALTAVTAEQTAQGTIYLYPVYNIVKYDAALIDASGNYSFFMADEFEANFATAIATPGSTVVLYSDIEYYKTYALKTGADVTIDLNGHTLTRVNLYGSIYNYDEAAGDYVAGTATESAVNAFTASKVKYQFAMISSAGKGTFRSVSVNGTAWYDKDGKLERYEATTLSGGAFMNNSQTSSGSSFTLENINIFALNIFYGSHNTGSQTHYINITNCNYYRTTGKDGSTNAGWGYDSIYTAGDARLTFKDSLFYLPSKSIFSSNIMFLRTQAGFATASAVFDNCDIISDNSGVGIQSDHASHTITFNNCRIYNITNHSPSHPTIFGNDTISSTTIAGKVTCAENIAIFDRSNTKTYSLPTSSKVTWDSENGCLVFDFGFEDREITFTKETVFFNEVYTKVTWLDANGEEIAVTDELKNATATIPSVKVPVGDGYRAFTNPNWLDENGEVVSLALGNLDAYTFKMSTELPENPEYVACVTEVLFSMSYYGHFGYNLYVPVAEGVTVTLLGGYAPSVKTVLIDGVEYWTANAGWPTPNTAIKSSTVYINYSIDGVDYSVPVTVSTKIYAELLFADSATSEVEKDAVLKLMAYIEEAYIYKDSDGVLDESTQAVFDTFFTNYNGGERPAYITEYPENELHTLDETFASYVDSITYALHSNNRATVLVTLSKKAVDEGYTLAMSTPTSFTGSVKDDAAGTVTYYTNNAKFATTIMSSKYTISVYDKDGTVVATTNYSLATYCKNVDSDFADALYTFGKAVIDVRAYLETL